MSRLLLLPPLLLLHAVNGVLEPPPMLRTEEVVQVNKIGFFLKKRRKQR